jgi:hypothetical protein
MYLRPLIQAQNTFFTCTALPSNREAPGSGFEGYLQFAERRALTAQGHLLSAYDKNGQIAGSCKPAPEKMSKAKVTERVLEIGGGHEVFYTPKAAWLDILQAWAERRQIFK